MLAVSSSARRALWVSVAATVVLYLMPVLNVLDWPLVLLSTAAHEAGHGVAAWIVGGEFHSLTVYADASGVALTAVRDARVPRALVAAGGLVGPAVVAAALFTAARSERHTQWALGAIGVVCLIAIPLLAGSLFTAGFLAILGLLSLAGATKASPGTAQVGLLFVAIQLALSVFSRGDYLFTPVAHTGAGVMPSDVANIAAALFLPYWFWGAVCGALSLAALGLGLRDWVR